MIDDLTPDEQRAIRALNRLQEMWPQSLWLFSASGRLNVMRAGKHGEQVHGENGGIDQNYVVTTVDIPNDGGDW